MGALGLSERMIVMEALVSVLVVGAVMGSNLAIKHLCRAYLVRQIKK